MAPRKSFEEANAAYKAKNGVNMPPKVRDAWYEAHPEDFERRHGSTWAQAKARLTRATKGAK